MTDHSESILRVYDREWGGDNDFSDVHRQAIVDDVERCWAAKTKQSRERAMSEWGDPAKAALFWTRLKRRLCT